MFQKSIGINEEISSLIPYSNLLEMFKIAFQPLTNWQESGLIFTSSTRMVAHLIHRHYVQKWSGNKIAKHLNDMGVKGKMGGTWPSSSVLRTCRYNFHENRNMFTAPQWWHKEPYHDSVSW